MAASLGVASGKRHGHHIRHMDKKLWVPGVSVVGAALACNWPLLAFPALIAVVLSVVVSTGRTRVLVAVVGGVLVSVATVRFTVAVALPGIMAGGRRSSEERAVSRLREIHWAQSRAREIKLQDTNHNGVGEYAPLALLVDQNAQLLNPEQYKPQDATTFMASGYFYRVYLPTSREAAAAQGEGVDATLAESRFVAYAWPATQGAAGNRVFFLDQDENVCESPNTQNYSGLQHTPGPFAAMDEARFGASLCGKAQDGGMWKPWKRKAIKPGPG